MQTFLNSDQHLEDRPAVSSPPWVWFGFVFAIAFLSAEFADLILDFDKQSLQLIFALIVLGGWIYWLFLCPPISQDPGRDDWTPLSHPAGRGRGKTLHPLLQSLLAFCVAFDPFITSQSGRPGKYVARRSDRFRPLDLSITPLCRRSCWVGSDLRGGFVHFGQAAKAHETG